MNKSPLYQRAIVSLFGVGYIKPLSATWGSLAAGIVLYFFWPSLSPGIKVLEITLVFVIGWVVSNQIERREKLHDPHFIVVDELVGMMITGFFLSQIWWQWLLAFFLFRFFDIAKLWPASIFDRRSGGFSLMIDDVIMALPALIALKLILRYLI